MRCLLAVQQTGMPPSKLSKKGPALAEQHEMALGSWLAEMRARGLRESTIRGQACSVRLFLAGIVPKAISDIGIGDVAEHVETRRGGSRPQTRAQVLYTLRSFLRFLAARGEVDQSVPVALGVIPGHKRSTLPSCYDTAEVAVALASVKSECPKRDRAIMLLAAVPGMRVGDIRRLRLTDMDMASRTVTILQSKTGSALVLPLTDEVAAAIADYVRSERPRSDDPHVFLHSRAPFACFEGTTDCFHWVVIGALGRGGVDTDGKHHGAHSLRHSAATGMLADGTPYPVISGVLGHALPNTTCPSRRRPEPSWTRTSRGVGRGRNKLDPDKVPSRSHPHALRHSKAMRMLEDGVNIVYIRDFLGHESVTTTERYARASTKAKREALESAESRLVPCSPYTESERSELLDWLARVV